MKRRMPSVDPGRIEPPRAPDPQIGGMTFARGAVDAASFRAATKITPPFATARPAAFRVVSKKRVNIRESSEFWSHLDRVKPESVSTSIKVIPYLTWQWWRNKMASRGNQPPPPPVKDDGESTRRGGRSSSRSSSVRGRSSRARLSARRRGGCISSRHHLGRFDQLTHSVRAPEAAGGAPIGAAAPPPRRRRGRGSSRGAARQGRP